MQDLLDGDEEFEGFDVGLVPLVWRAVLLLTLLSLQEQFFPLGLQFL